MSNYQNTTEQEIKKQLVYLYRQQTQEEQDSQQTIENNSRGFNGVDAEFLSSMAKWVLAGKCVTEKQLLSLQLRVPKYKLQLETGEWQHIELPEEVLYTAAHTQAKNTLDIDPRTGGLVFFPAVFPSKQIRTLAPFYWQDSAWHQARPHVTEGLVQSICHMFGQVEVSEAVQKKTNPNPVELPKDISEHEILFPFQKETIQFCLTQKHVLIGLAPGLGKTACAIFAAQAARCKHILVVAPLSLVYNWRNEIKKWVGEPASIWYKKQLPVESKWVITNYDTLRLHPVQFIEEWDAIIVDESILIKNRKAIRSKAVKTLVLATKPKFVWLLSGAPISKLYDDLWMQCNILRPNRFTSYWRFTQRYCFIESNVWSAYNIVANKPEAAEMLKTDLQDMYFSKNQEDVLDLPDWILEDISVEMDEVQDRLYAEMEDSFVVSLEDGSSLLAPNVLAQLMRLVQLASNPALIGGKDVSAKMAAVKDMLEYEQGPFIVWVNFIKTAEYLEKYLQDAGYRVAKLTGATKSEDRQLIVDKFQNGGLDVLVANPQVGRFGLNLFAARTIIYLERTHDGDAYYQSLYRVKRIGTKYSPHVVHLIAERHGGGHTVDFVIGKVLEARKNSVLALTSGELKKLFTEIRK